MHKHTQVANVMYTDKHLKKYLLSSVIPVAELRLLIILQLKYTGKLFCYLLL